MQDHVPKALLIVNKKGEFLDKITLLDNVKGVVEHFFEYITGSLTDVTFEIRAAEDIKAADGVSPDYYSKDELVATVTTDANGVAEVSDLPVGKYYVKEVGTAYGYILDEEPRYVDLSYRDQDTPVVVYDEDWQNNRQKVKVNVLKKEKDTDRVLKGGIFGLYTRNDILSASGKVLMEADTLIELKTTDVDGKISFIADLPIDGTYYVKELYAPDGFVTTGEEQEFVFEYQGDKEAEVSYEFVFEDEPTTVELSKTDLTTGEELPGARLQLTDENGDVVEEWTSTKEAHIIKELVVGKSYTLTETKPADGYATAESITFTVENTVEIQKQVMEDDVTKVEISKTDITGDNEIEGAKLTITDENGNIVETWTSGKEPHYIEKLPIGKYTLKEEQAPNGYVVSEEITFEVADTAEIQKVAMKDDTAKGRLIIEKTDKDTGAALKGAEFELRDADGKVVETLTTDENGHATSGLLAIGTYKDGKFDKAAIYYLVETKAPEGYQMDETKHEVTFTYVDDKTPVIEVIQKVTNEKLPEDTPSVSNPKTGDDTNLWFPALCLILSTGGLIGMGVASRRKKKKGADRLKQLYFAYGSNMDLDQMAYRCPKAEMVETVRLEGYRLTFAAAGSGLATIFPEEGSHVDGVLWSLTGDCEKSLDLYEGYPDFYDKQEITVKNKGGREIKAIVYIMTKDYMQNFNPPGRSYLTGILKGCRQNQIPTEPILKAARKPPVPGQTQKSQPKKQRKAGQER